MKRNSSSTKPDVVRILVGMAAFVVVVAGIRSVASIIDQLLLAAIIALTLSPMLTWIMAKVKSYTAAVAITISVAVIGGLALAGMLGVAIAGLIRKLPDYTSRISDMKASFEHFLDNKGIDPTIIMGATPDPSQLLGIGTVVLGSVSSALGTTAIVLVIAAFMLAEAPALTKSFESYSDKTSAFMKKMDKIRTEVMRYLSLLGLMNLMIAGGNTIAFFILGVDYAIVWGVLSFFLSFVPYIGFVMYVAPPVLLEMMDHGWVRAVILLVILVVVNFIVDNVVKPIFMKGGFNISFLMIMLSFIFWGYIFGGLGFILAVPLTMTAKILLLDEDPDIEVDMPGEKNDS